jgi:hypothetical protein
MCVATVNEPVTRPQSAGLVSQRPLWLALALTAVIIAVRMTGTVDSDVAWQLWIAQRIHAGADLYRDIIETNPPLWFWMALPVDRAATFLHVRPEPVLVAAMGLLVALSLAATERLICHINPKRRTLLLGFGALALAAMPWAHVGQREHIVLIGTIPYAALIAARREGRRVPAGLAILVGVGAALGFALKQYFLLAPAALELWLLASLRGRWRAVRPETVAIVGVGLGYAAALVAFERDFLTTVVPLIGLAYGVFGAPSLSYMFGPFAILGLTILGFALAHARHLAGRRAPLHQRFSITCRMTPSSSSTSVTRPSRRFAGCITATGLARRCSWHMGSACHRRSITVRSTSKSGSSGSARSSSSRRRRGPTSWRRRVAWSSSR